MHVVNTVILLAVFWAMNSGYVDPTQAVDRFLLGCGVVSIVLVTWVSHRLRSMDRESDPLPVLWPILRYFPWLTWQIIVSNIQVAKLVWSPRPRICPQLFTIPCRLRSGLAITTYANSITLTPGTVTVDVQPGEMLIHSLTDMHKQDLLTGAMEAHVARLEGGGHG